MYLYDSSTAISNTISRSDNDMYGHLNNPIYGAFVDSIVNAFLIAHCGLEPSNPHSTSKIALVANSFMDFFASIEYPAVADCGLRITKLGTSSVTYEVGIFERGKEGVKAVGGFTQVWVTRKGVAKNEGGVVVKETKGIEPHVRKEMEKLLTGPGNESFNAKL